jgi:hypothetical protein
MAFHAYTDAQWAAIERVLQRAKLPATETIRFKLEEFGRDYVALHGQRERRLSKEDYALLHRCIELLNESRRLRTVFKSALAYMKSHEAVTVAWTGEPFWRTGDPYRDALYICTIELWSDLEGPFTVSDTGPLARFLRAVLKPILGTKTPSPRGVKGVIAREKYRREHHLKYFWQGYPAKRWP